MILSYVLIVELGCLGGRERHTHTVTPYAHTPTLSLRGYAEAPALAASGDTRQNSHACRQPRFKGGNLFCL